MSQPLFKVGERVGLASVTFPERNGDYTVRQVLSRGDLFKCRLTGRVLVVTPSKKYSYALEENYKEGSHNHEALWCESTLRKLHKPSQYSFEGLLSKIKQCNMNTIGD